MVWERISGEEEVDGSEWRLHVSRYRYARGFVAPGDVVVDAACGTGYARPLFEETGAEWHGRDRLVGHDLTAHHDTWMPEDGADVFVGLETMEHLSDWHPWVAGALTARKWIVMSTPIIPTKHFNPHHVHDFTENDVLLAFDAPGWELFDLLHQQDGVYGLFAFRRVN